MTVFLYKRIPYHGVRLYMEKKIWVSCFLGFRRKEAYQISVWAWFVARSRPEGSSGRKPYEDGMRMHFKNGGKECWGERGGWKGKGCGMEGNMVLHYGPNEPRILIKYCAIRSSVRSFACATHSFACSGVLASLACFARSLALLARLLHLLARSLTHS